MKRILCFTVGFLVTVSVLGVVPHASGYSVPTVGPPFSEKAVDIDNDGDFDELRISFSATTQEPGQYRFDGLLRTPTTYIAWNQTRTPLPRGTFTINISFAGPYINRSGVDGPYTLELQPWVEWDNGGMSGPTYTYTTQAYRASTFDPPPARLRLPFSDEGRDDDSDGLYDELIVHVTVHVIRTTGVTVWGYLNGLGYSPTPSDVIRTYAPGDYVWDLAFDGLPMYSRRADGPYSVSVYLSLEGLGAIDYQYYQTSAYSHMQFTRPPADFANQPAVTTLDDPDGNGFADYLRVTVPLQVRKAGNYYVTAQLTDPLNTYSYLFRTRASALQPGPQSIELKFSGISLSRFANDGPWSIGLSVGRAGGTDDERNYSAISTPSYVRSQFESRPLSWFYGTAMEGDPGPWVQCAFVYAADIATGFVVESYISYGSISLPLYNGTFVALFEPCDGRYESMVAEITAPGDGSFRWIVRRGSAEWVNQTLEMTNWNTSRIETIHATTTRNMGIRFWADQIGNFDGYADTTELFLYEEFLRSYLGQFSGDILIDGRRLQTRSTTHLSTEGEGDLLSNSAVASRYEATYRDAREPAAGLKHNVTLRLYYDNEFVRYALRLRLPPGSTGSVNSTGNVTITPIGPGGWDLDPGTAPPNNPYGVLFVYIDAIAPENPVLGVAPAVVVLGLLAITVAVVIIGSVAYTARRRKRPPAMEAAPGTPPTLETPTAVKGPAGDAPRHGGP